VIDTLILYADRHSDLRRSPRSYYTCGNIFPTYPIDGLRVVRIHDLDAPGGPHITLVSPQLRDELCEDIPTIGGKQQLERVIALAQTARRVHWHIDPDLFYFSAELQHYFISSELLFPCMQHQDETDTINPASYLSLVRRMRPDFFGVFQYYLSDAVAGRLRIRTKHITPEKIRENIDRLIEQGMGNCDIALLPRAVAMRVDAVGGLDRAARIIPYRVRHTMRNVVEDTSEGIFHLRASNSITGVELQESDGRPIALDGLCDEGQVFGVFDSHLDALATFTHA